MEIIYIVGPPGSGKTYGERTLDPMKTFIVNSDFKSLTFRGGGKNYIDGKNYIEESDPDAIRTWIHQVASATKKDGTFRFNSLIIDTANAIMNDIEMSVYEGKVGTMTQGQWYELAKAMYALIKPLQRGGRKDFFIFILFHEGEDDKGRRSVLTNGRKLEKIQLEGLVNWCFFTEVNGGKFELSTVNTGDSKAKRKEDALPDIIPNDFQLIIDLISKYEQGE